MEEVFHHISKNFVTINKRKMRKVRMIVKKVITKITNEMKIISPFFQLIFESHTLIGSVYDGLKAGKPDEFDIDLKLLLPETLDVEIQPTNKPGFVQLHLKGWKNLIKDYNRIDEYKELAKFITNDHYLSQGEIKLWMERIIKTTIDRIEQNGEFGRHIRKVNYETREPAVTLKMETYYNTEISVDLVSAIRLPGEVEFDLRQNFRHVKQNYFVVPETPRSSKSDNSEELKKCWRLSFPEQEREYIKNLYSFKPVLRTIKKLRDTQNHNIPSYFIKTMFLWEVRYRDRSFWQSSYMDVFIEMLKTYKNYIANQEIPYFWNAGHNLIEPNSEIHLNNISGELEEIILDIENSRYTEPLALAYYLLPAKDYEKVRQHFQGIF